MLRELQEKDTEGMLEWIKDPEINCFFQFDADSRNRERVLEFIRNINNDEKSRHYAIVDKDDEYLGTISLKNIDDKNNINLDLLASKTDGYTGADIENVIIESVENVFSEGKNRLTTEDITKVINETSSLSVIMKESIDSMTEEYKKRKFKNASM